MSKPHGMSATNHSTPRANHKRKRKSLVEDEPEANVREANAEIAQEVDTLILDYQIHRTIESVLRPSIANVDRSTKSVSRPTTTDNLQQETTLCRNVTALWSWISLYNSRHTAPVHDPEIRLRLSLAKFLVLYCERMSPGNHIPQPKDLESLRAENLKCVEHRITALDKVPSLTYDVREVFDNDPGPDDTTLEYFRDEYTLALGMTKRYKLYGTAHSVAILDVLPQFMRICAAYYANIQRQPALATMRLFIDLIRQAYLEQFLVYGNGGCDIIDAAFSWGCSAAALTENDSLEDRQLDEMFRDSQTGREHIQWHDMREAALAELMFAVGQAEPLRARLVRLASTYSLYELDEKIKGFLFELWTALDPPILSQLERGQLIGMSQEETSAFLQSCGISKEDWSNCFAMA